MTYSLIFATAACAVDQLCEWARIPYAIGLTSSRYGLPVRGADIRAISAAVRVASVICAAVRVSLHSNAAATPEATYNFLSRSLLDTLAGVQQHQLVCWRRRRGQGCDPWCALHSWPAAILSIIAPSSLRLRHPPYRDRSYSARARGDAGRKVLGQRPGRLASRGCAVGCCSGGYAYTAGAVAGGSQGPVVNSCLSASSLSMPHLAAVDR